MHTGSRVSDGMSVPTPASALGALCSQLHPIWGSPPAAHSSKVAETAELSQSGLADVPSTTDLCLSTDGRGSDRGRALTALGREPKIAALKVEMNFASATWTLSTREKLWAKLMTAVINLTQIQS